MIQIRYVYVHIPVAWLSQILVNIKLAAYPCVNAQRITADAALNHEWFREVPLPKSKDFMPTFPAQHARDRYVLGNLAWLMQIHNSDHLFVVLVI